MHYYWQAVRSEEQKKNHLENNIIMPCIDGHSHQAPMIKLKV